MESTKYPGKLDELIVRYMAGELSPEDKWRLARWRDESEGNELLFQKLIKEENWKQGVHKIAEYDTKIAWTQVNRKVDRKKSIRLRKYYLEIAAAIAIVCGVGLILLRQPESKKTFVAARDIPVSGVRLSRSSGEVYRLDTLRRLDLPSVVLESDSGRMIIKSNDHINSPKGVEMNTIDVPRGAEYSLVLADGTKVLLNAESSFCFPESFKDKATREVYLTGEAYFEVSEDSQHPFIVHTDLGYVKVLGTSFNVMAYKNRPLLQATLVKGHVRIGDNQTNREMDLIPGMQGALNKSTGEMNVCKVDVSYYTAWKEGVFAFREQRLEDVMEVLSRWYGFEYFFRNAEMRDYVYTGKVVRHGDLKKVLDNFRMTEELDFWINGNTVIIQNKN